MAFNYVDFYVDAYGKLNTVSNSGILQNSNNSVVRLLTKSDLERADINIVKPDKKAFPKYGMLLASYKMAETDTVNHVFEVSDDGDYFVWEFTLTEPITNFVMATLTANLVISFHLYFRPVGTELPIVMSSPNCYVSVTRASNYATIAYSSAVDVDNLFKRYNDIISGSAIVAKATGDAAGENIATHFDAVEASVATETANRIADVNTEEAARILADQGIQAELDQEELDRASADTTLQGNINTVQSNLDTEEAARILADGVLQDNIDAEEASRISADSTLQGNINTVDDKVDQEILDRASQDSAYDATNVHKTGNETIAGDKVFSGTTTVQNLVINGTSSTINSTTVTLDDPILTLGGDTAPTVNDSKDRGVEFRYFDTAAKIGFMGWDNSLASFALYKDATNTGEIFSGTLAPLRIGSQRIVNPNTTDTPLIVDNGVTLDSWASLQDWRLLNTTVARITADGALRGTGLYNLTSSNNALISTGISGTIISRNVADAATTLTVNKQNASSTGYILDFQSEGSNVVRIAKSGIIYAPSIMAINSANGSFTLGGSAASPTIKRDSADAYAALTINQQNASSTGHIVDFNAQAANKSFIDRDGYLSSAAGKVLATNLITNGGFSANTTSWTGSGSTLSVVSEAMKILADTGTAHEAYQVCSTLPIANHIYYFCAKTVSLSGSYVKYYVTNRISGGSYESFSLLVNSVGTYSFIYKPTSIYTSPSLQVRFVLVNPYNNSENFQTTGVEYATIDNVDLIDLTALFGAGNEPTQLQMDTLLLRKFPTTSGWFDGTQEIATVAEILANKVGKVYGTNIVANGSFTSTTGWSITGTGSVANNILTIVGTPGNNITALQTSTSIIGRKYYYSAQFMTPDTLSGAGVVGWLVGNSPYQQAYVTAPTASKYYTISNIWTCDAANAYIRLRLGDTDVTNKTLNVKWANMLDLTAIFGAGYEPTVEQMDALMSLQFTNSWFDGTTEILSLPTLAKLKASVAQEAWITPTLLNSWVAFSTNDVQPSYRKNTINKVCIRGLIKNGAGTGGTYPFWTLPTGYRPAKTIWTIAISNGVAVPLIITIGGNVYVATGSTTYVGFYFEFDLD